MSKKSNLKRFLLDIYGFAFFNKMTLMTPVYAVFMQANGISDIQLSFLMMLYPIGILVTQFYVTWVTLKIGQKRAIVLGQIMKCIAFALMWLTPFFLGFAIAMFLWGIQAAFSSVAYEGLLYDELDARGYKHIYTRAVGIKYSTQAAGTALSAFGSLLMFWGYGWITIASIVALVMSMICALNLPLTKKDAPNVPDVRPDSKQMWKIGRKLFRENKCILLIMMLSVLVTNFAYLDDYLSPIGVGIGLPVEYVGLMPFLLLGCSVLGQTFAYRFNRIGPWGKYAAICAGGALFVLFGLMYSIAALPILALSYLIFSILNVLLFSQFQNSIPTAYRPLMLSFHSIGTNVAYVSINLLIGLGSTFGSWRYSIIILGICLILIGIWAAISIRNRCSISGADDVTDIGEIRSVGNSAVA